MGVISYRPVTPTRRFGQVSDFAELTKSRPEKSLTIFRKRSGGRNNYGHITSPRRGGGAKQRIRILDFKRARLGIGKVLSIEYDPGRTARIALVEYEDKERVYILAPDKLAVGDVVENGAEVEIRIGNHLPLAKVPAGAFVHNIELRKGGGGKLVRAAGAAAIVMTVEGDFVHLKLPSGEVRKFKSDCYATLGQCSNLENSSISLGKAGRNRWKGKRPRVRAVAMNPIDHPMGGGEGKTSGGRHPVSRKGQAAKGLKTRRKRKHSSQFIVKHRRAKK